MEKISECCKNLDKKIESLKLQKSKANIGLNKDRSDTKHIKKRDEILCELNSLWNAFSCAELKQHINSAAYFDLFQITSKENGRLLKVLIKCLNCDDHFIAFQCHKLFIEVYKCFPNLVTGDLFDQLIGSSLSDLNCGRWLSIYTAEILKALFLELDYLNVSNFHENSFKCQHVSSDEKEKQIGTKDILDSLCYQWLKMTNHFLVKLSALVLKQSTSLPEGAQESRFDTFQQILLTMLSGGKTLIQSCDFLLNSQPIPITSIQKAAGKYVGMDVPKCDECSKKSKRAKIYENGSLSVSKVCPSCHMCKEAIFKDDDKFECFSSDVVSCTMECKLKLFKKIVRQLVELDHKRCSLHLSRTIFQFLNDAVSSILDHCFKSESKGISSQDGLLKATKVCSVLVENVNKMLENIPQVIGKVHFGGQNCGREESDRCGPLYDDVCLRKVLLLALKSILAHFHVQKGRFGELQWQALKEPVDRWLNFVTHTSLSNADLAVAWLVQLFCDQDDELVYLLFCLLQLYQGLFCSKSSQSVLIQANHLCNSLNPHGFFMEFLSSVNYDHSLLLDFLISNETHFLPYFLNYLRYMANDWDSFIETVKQRMTKNKHKDLLQSSGIVQVPKRRGLGFLNCSRQFHRTAFGHGIDTDADDVDGSLDVGSDWVVGGIFVDVGCDEGGDGLNYDGDCDDIDCSSVAEHSSIDHGDNGRNDDSDHDRDDVNDDDDCDCSGDDFSDNSNGCNNTAGGDYGASFSNHDNDGGGCTSDVSAKHTSSDSDVEDGAENKPRTCNHSTEGTASLQMPFSRSSDLEQILSCLIRLRFAIERMAAKRLFPYPVTALVRVMKYVETLYEGEG